MKLWFYAFFMAWGMFLSIPCPFPKWDENARERMLSVFPMIGIIIGGIWALFAYLMPLIRCPKPVAALVLSVVPWVVTGFMHLDGFSDVCDAVLSRRDLKTRQKILKDPHCGSFAVISLIMLALAQFSLFLSAGSFHLLTLAAIPVASRGCAALAVLLLTPMETSQYSRIHGGKSGVTIKLVPAISLASAILAPICLFGFHGIAPAVCAIFYWLFAWRGVRSLGGMNGDISGFALSLGELMGIAALILIG